MQGVLALNPLGPVQTMAVLGVLDPAHICGLGLEQVISTLEGVILMFGAT